MLRAETARLTSFCEQQKDAPGKIGHHGQDSPGDSGRDGRMGCAKREKQGRDNEKPDACANQGRDQNDAAFDFSLRADRSGAQRPGAAEQADQASNQNHHLSPFYNRRSDYPFRANKPTKLSTIGAAP